MCTRLCSKVRSVHCVVDVNVSYVCTCEVGGMAVDVMWTPPLQMSDLRQRAAQAESEVEGAQRELQDVRVSCDGRVAAVTEDHEKLQSRCEELEGQNTLLHSQVERLSMQLVTEQSSHVGDDTSSMVSSIVSVGMEPTGDQVWEIVR